MIEIILGIAAVGLLGYVGYKMIIKHETPLEAITEIKDEIVYEAKHLEVVVEHKIEDALHSLEDQVSARAKAAGDLFRAVGEFIGIDWPVGCARGFGPRLAAIEHHLQREFGSGAAQQGGDPARNLP